MKLARDGGLAAVLSKAGELKSQMARDREDQQLVMTAQMQVWSRKRARMQRLANHRRVRGAGKRADSRRTEKGDQEPRKAAATQAARLAFSWTHASAHGEVELTQKEAMVNICMQQLIEEVARQEPEPVMWHWWCWERWESWCKEQAQDPPTADFFMLKHFMIRIEGRQWLLNLRC